jgi:pyruvate dehydrogenase E2 component (dihydrolipoamide acetyltransferase)
VKASPIARRLARARGVDLGSVAGTGPAGRIVRADVEAAAVPGGGAQAPVAAQAAHADETPAAPGGGAQAPVAAQPAQGDEPAAVSTAKGETTTVELTRTQQTVARRMAESRATIPDFSLEVDVDMDACVALRSELKGIAGSRGGADAAAGAASAEVAVVPTYNDMVVKACALALREQPRVNSSYRDGSVQLHARVNVGVAVAAEGTLVVPTVFDADTKALGEIARETHALVERVRSGEITPPELGGGTFTVSNLGMLGATSFTAIINPPQAAILTVGALERRAAVAQDDAVVARSALTLTLICDHRVLYGADAARFAGRVRELLQAPAALTL